MDLDKLKTFSAVVTAGSFARASGSVYRSASAISRQILELEESLGVQLFNRHPRGLTLTGSGEILYQTTLEVLAKLDRTETLLRIDKTETKGPLRLATTYALSNAWLTQYLRGFLDLYPEINLTVIGNDENLDLQMRQADVAIRTALPHQPELTQLYLATFHLRLYATPEYLEKFGTPQTPEDLDHHRLLVFGDDSAHPYGNINWVLHFGVKPRQPSRVPFLRINSAYGLKRAAEAGLGIAALSQEYHYTEKTNLVLVLPNQIGPSVKIYYVYPNSLQDFKRVTVLGEFLQEKTREQYGPQSNG